MADPDSGSRVVRPGVLLFCAVVVLAAVVVGGYKLTHQSPAPATAAFVPQATVPVTYAVTTPSIAVTPTTQRASTPDPTSNIVNINRVAMVSGMRIDVVAMECGLTKVGSGYATIAASPGSQYCLVRVNVTNRGSSPNMWSAGGQTAFDERSRSFSSESMALMYVSNSNFSGLNPGMSEPDVIPFELPLGDRLTRNELYAGYTGSPAIVPLT